MPVFFFALCPLYDHGRGQRSLSQVQKWWGRRLKVRQLFNQSNNRSIDQSTHQGGVSIHFRKCNKWQARRLQESQSINQSINLIAPFFLVRYSERFLVGPLELITRISQHRASFGVSRFQEENMVQGTSGVAHITRDVGFDAMHDDK